MNRLAKVLSVVLSAAIVLSVTAVLLISAFAADVPTFSLNVKSETDSEVVVTVNLDSGEFKAIDLSLQAKSAVAGCKNAVISSAVKDFRNESEDRGNVMSSATNAETMKVSMATVEAYKTVGPIAEFTLSKAAAAKITKDDVSLVVTSCVVDKDAVKANVVNNLPAAEAPTEKPTEAPTEAPVDDETTTAAPADDETTTAAPADDETTTEAPADDETTTAAPADDETTTEAPADDETTTEAPADDETTTEAPADDETTTAAPAEEDPTAAPADSTDDTGSAEGEPVADAAEPAAETAESDISNPATGDSLTATAAVISLLAVSGAAVVALRKKED